MIYTISIHGITSGAKPSGCLLQVHRKHQIQARYEASKGGKDSDTPATILLKNHTFSNVVSETFNKLKQPIYSEEETYCKHVRSY